MAALGPGRVKTRHRGHDVKYSSKQEPKRAIKQRHTSQLQIPTKSPADSEMMSPGDTR
jgi:hypothetical protein